MKLRLARKIMVHEQWLNKVWTRWMMDKRGCFAEAEEIRPSKRYTARQIITAENRLNRSRTGRAVDLVMMDMLRVVDRLPRDARTRALLLNGAEPWTAELAELVAIIRRLRAIERDLVNDHLAGRHASTRQQRAAERRAAETGATELSDQRDGEDQR
jgi:hypothetical protein